MGYDIDALEREMCHRGRVSEEWGREVQTAKWLAEQWEMVARMAETGTLDQIRKELKRRAVMAEAHVGFAQRCADRTRAEYDESWKDARERPDEAIAIARGYHGKQVWELLPEPKETDDLPLKDMTVHDP